MRVLNMGRRETMSAEKPLERFLAVSRSLHTACGALSLSVLLCAMSFPAAATSLLSEFGTPFYVEDYQGESSYPTSPEVDALGIGALTPLLLGNAPLPPPPTLTGTSARLEMSTSAGAEEFQGVGLTNATPMSLGPDLDLALHIEADSFTESLVGDGLVVLGATLFSDSGVNVFASLVHPPELATMWLVLGEETDSVVGETVVFLSMTATAAILSGGAFEIDLVLDRQAGSIAGAITANAEEFIAPTLLLSQLGTQSIVRMSHTSLIDNTFGDDDGLTAAFTRMQLHVRAHSVVTVEIDIKPGSSVNPINLRSRGVVPAAILGSDTFDVADVDVSTLAFGPDGAPLADRKRPHLGDINHDGFPDLLAHFRRQGTGIAFGDTEACVRGELLDGTPFEGCDSVRTIPPGCGSGFESALVMPPLIWLRKRRLH
jgi:hypothetical protein